MKKLRKLIRCVFSGIPVLIFSLSYGYSYAGTYYCSPSGGTNWNGSVTILTPCNLATAFLNASAGDTVYLRGGSYTTGTKSSVNNGTSSNRVIFRAYPGESPMFTGGVGIHINHDYWTLDGIIFSNITHNASGYPIVMLDVASQYCEIKNCTFRDVGNDIINGSPGVISIDSESKQSNNGYHTVDNCKFINICDNTVADGASKVIGIGYGGNRSHYNTISNCTFTNFQAYGVIIWNGSSYNKIKGCTFDNNDGYGLGISINDQNHSGISAHNLVDECIFKNFSKHQAPGTGYWKSAIQLYGDYNTIRRCLFYDFGSGSGGSAGYGIEAVSARDNLVYNNVFCNIYSSAIIWVNDNVRTDLRNKMYNNIFWKNMQANNAAGYQRGSQVNWQYPGISKATFEGETYACRLDYNFIQYVNTRYDPIMHFYLSLTYLMSLSELHSNFPNTTATHSNIEASGGPGFVDEGGRDFHLAAGSPCVDAGVIVNDLAWGNLPYKGSAPDIGAFESEGLGAPLGAPRNLKVVK